MIVAKEKKHESRKDVMRPEAQKPVAMGSGGKVKNPVAKGLSDSKFKPRVVKPKKGKGSYSRKGKALSYSSGGKTKSKVNEAGNYTKPGMRKRLVQRN